MHFKRHKTGACHSLRCVMTCRVLPCTRSELAPRGKRLSIPLSMVESRFQHLRYVSFAVLLWVPMKLRGRDNHRARRLGGWEVSGIEDLPPGRSATLSQATVTMHVSVAVF